MSELLDDLTTEQRKALQQFRIVIADLDTPEKTDHYYLMWLIARKFNVSKAEVMIRTSMSFRKEMGVDTILTDYNPPEVLRECYTGGVFGEDREGYPVFYCALGNLDFKGLYRSTRKEDMVKFNIQFAEKHMQLLAKMSQQHNRVINALTMVVDLENLSIQKHYYWPMIHIVNESFSMFEANYPERCRRIVIVKAPKIFPLAFNIVKHFLEERTRRKIVITGANWREELQKHISEDNLPEFYGGTRREPDATCSDHILMGKDVPEKYYFTNLLESSMEDMEMVAVNRGSSSQLQYPVDIPGTVIRWEIVTKGYDIGFGLYYKPPGHTDKLHAGEMEVKLPTERKECHLIPETGIHTCMTTGIYVMRFDNTYSWTRAKEVYYSIKVLPPDTELCHTSPADIRAAVVEETRRLSSSRLSIGSNDSFHSVNSQDTPTQSTSPKLQGHSTAI